MTIQQETARVLLEIGAVRFQPANPITFKSGILSPVYVDNRRLPFHPLHWQIVINGFARLIADADIHFDIIAGIETAGIPHSAALAYSLLKPSVFVRKQAKEHGTRSRIEGGGVNGRGVLLIEDLVTTGSSSLSGVGALKEENATVTNCLAIVSYGLREATEAFAAANVTLHTLTTFDVILREAAHLYTVEQLNVIRDWLDDPVGWAARRGLA